MSDFCLPTRRRPLTSCARPAKSPITAAARNANTTCAELAARRKYWRSLSARLFCLVPSSALALGLHFAYVTHWPAPLGEAGNGRKHTFRLVGRARPARAPRSLLGGGGGGGARSCASIRANANAAATAHPTARSAASWPVGQPASRSAGRPANCGFPYLISNRRPRGRGK